MWLLGTYILESKATLMLYEYFKQIASKFKYFIHF